MPPLSPDVPGLVNLGSQVEPKSMQKRWQKGGAKVDAKRQKINALNPNPLALAQSKSCLSLSGKTRNSIENTSFQLPFSVFFCTFFEPFPEKSQKGSRVPPQSLKKTPKWSPRVPKWSPRILKWSPKAPKVNKKHTTVYQECQHGAPGVTMGS